jgi:hypothetical protein
LTQTAKFRSFAVRINAESPGAGLSKSIGSGNWKTVRRAATFASWSFASAAFAPFQARNGRNPARRSRDESSGLDGKELQRGVELSREGFTIQKSVHDIRSNGARRPEM